MEKKSEKRDPDETIKNINSGLLPNGEEKDIRIIINPKPNLHLNLGQH